MAGRADHDQAVHCAIDRQIVTDDVGKFIAIAGEIEMGTMPPTRPFVRIVSGYARIAYGGRGDMRALSEEMKVIKRAGGTVPRRHRIKLARRYVRAKWAMQGRRARK